MRKGYLTNRMKRKNTVGYANKEEAFVSKALFVCLFGWMKYQ